jgi:hypothetical protein
MAEDLPDVLEVVTTGDGVKVELPKAVYTQSEYLAAQAEIPGEDAVEIHSVSSTRGSCLCESRLLLQPLFFLCASSPRVGSHPSFL